MAHGKKYYWIKLKDTFLTSDVVDYLMTQPNGANYVVLYQILCLKTINTEGRLARRIGEVLIPYDIEKIQRDCKWFSVDTVRVALNLYRSFGLIYEDNNGVLALTDHNNLVGSETDYAVQKRLQREYAPTPLPTPKGAQEKCPFAEIMKLYHATCPSFPKIRGIQGERKKLVAARWKENEKMETFETVFRLAEQSDFLKGANARQWEADFDWMMIASNFVKILEHKYDNRSEGSFSVGKFFEAATARTYGRT